MQIILIYVFEIFVISWHKVVFDWRMEQKEAFWFSSESFSGSLSVGFGQTQTCLFFFLFHLGNIVSIFIFFPNYFY